MIFKKVKEIAVDKLSVEEDEVTLGASFKDDLGADSLDLFEFVMALEDEFDIQISNEDVEGIQTVQDAVNYIQANQ